MFRVILLDHSKIDAGDLQMMQFGGFDARVKRIKGALEEGKYWWEDVEVATKPEVQDCWAEKAAKLKERLIQTGDTVIDEGGKIWMLDYTGWENVSKQLAKPLAGEIEMLRDDLKRVDTIHTTDVVEKKQKDRVERDQEKNMPGTQNGVNTAAADEVVMLPPAEIAETDDNDTDEGEEALEAKPAPKKRGRKPGSKNKPKAEVVAKPAAKKASAKPAAKKASAKPAAKKAAAKAPKAAKKTAKAAAPKTRKKGIVGVKAQTQVEKAAFAEILRRAKEQDGTAADIVRIAVYKYIGYKPEQA